MEQGRSADDIADVVRAHRFELVDDRGHIWAVLEHGVDDEGGPRAWLRLFDDNHEQVTLTADSSGPRLSLAMGGNTVAELGGNSQRSLDAAVSLVLCDGMGQAIIRWLVSADGKLVEERTPPKE